MSLQLLRVVIIILLLLIIAGKEEILDLTERHNVTISNKMNITVKNNIFYVYTLANETGTIAHTFKRYNGAKLEKENFKCSVVNNISNISYNSFKEPEGYANEDNIYTVTADVDKYEYMVTQLTDVEPNEVIQVYAIKVEITMALLIIIIIIVSVLLGLILLYWNIKKYFN